MAAYTYGKSLDDSSSLSEPVYPMGAALTKAISAFDLRHNFVASYRYHCPSIVFRAQNRWTTGWSLSGITRFSTGLPVTLYNNTDSSLLGTFPTASTTTASIRPTTPPATWSSNHIRARDRRSTPRSSVRRRPCRALGNVPRRFFYGPGQENFDMALQKDLPMGQSFCSSASRPLTSSIMLSSSEPPPSMEISAARVSDRSSTQMPPRQVQLAAKFVF